MGKGDIRTRRGKIWRGTYGVTRPRRYKTVVRPHAATRKVKTLKDLPKAVAQPIVKKPVVETIQKEVVTAPVAVHQPVVEVVTKPVVEVPAAKVEAATPAKKAAAKKAPVAKKGPAAKKAPAKKKK